MKKRLLFDFDGVILDSFDVAFDINTAQHPGIQEDDYRSAFKGNIYSNKMGNHVCTEDCDLEMDFFGVYEKRVKEESVIFPGMKEVIDSLSKDFDLSIISSTRSDVIQNLLERDGLNQYFDDILGSDVHKGKTEKIGMIFDKYNLESEECVFITDTLGDILESKKVNVDSIAVSWGYHDVSTLKEGNPAKIVHNPNELEEYLRK